ncbi:MAG: hypothetical protein RDV00_09765 [Clostridia bacterium]|nr:hypothetical protein [Clostridia bacterium]MDQ7792389.1 hypothetical protein [Clostridia bacterium]
MVTHTQQIEELHSNVTKLAVHVEGEITEKIRGLYNDREVVKDTPPSFSQPETSGGNAR